jgi:alcohol dehydrogenase class IV
MIQYGIGAVRETIARHLDEIGCERAIVLTGRTLAGTAEIMNPLVSSLGKRYLDTVVPPDSHGEVAGVIQLCEALRSRRPDGIVSLGGGSVMDFAKAVAGALGHDLRSVDAFDTCFGTRRPEHEVERSADARQPLPQIAIPTTLAGAQHSAASGFTDPATHTKRIYFHGQLLPGRVILDPEITVTTPADLWAGSGIKALDHVIEKYYAIPPHPIIDAMAIAAAPVIFAGLPLSMDPTTKDAMQYRLDLLIGSWQAMSGSVGVFKSGLSHALGRQLGAICGVAHGATSCVTLPGVIEFNLAAAAERLRDLGVAFGLSATRSPAGVPAAVRDLIESLGLPTRLRDVSVSRDDLGAVARQSMKDPAVGTNPRRVNDAQEIEALLQSIW